MKKLLIMCIAMLVVGVMTTPTIAVQYCKDVLEEGNPGGWSGSLKTCDEEIVLEEPGTVVIDIWLNDLRGDVSGGRDTLISTGFEAIWTENLTVKTDGTGLIPYDTAHAGPWDPSMKYVEFSPNYVYVSLGSFSCPMIDTGNDMIVAKLEIEVQGEGGTITFRPVEGFDTTVSCKDSLVYDSEIPPNTFTIIVGPVCGNGVKEGDEQCDGNDAAACPGLCQVNCTCGTPPECDVTLDVGDATARPGDSNVPVQISLENLNNKVRGVQMDICEVDGKLTAASSANLGTVPPPPPPDCLVCAGCVTTNRTAKFRCETNELENGCCRVVLVSDTGNLIEKGTGPIFTLKYNTSEDCPGGCKVLSQKDVKVSDALGYPLEDVCTPSGKLCFSVCGDLFPEETSRGADNCGGNGVDIFDVVEAIDIVLGVGVHSSCQMAKANVPTGTPPSCHAPDGEIDIFDIIVIIDVAIEREPNCCGFAIE